MLKNEFLRKSFELKRKLHSPAEDHSFNELFTKFSKLNIRHNKLEYVHLFGLYAFSDDYKDTIDNILKNTLTKLNSSRELTNENKKSIKPQPKTNHRHIPNESNEQCLFFFSKFQTSHLHK